MFCKRKFGFDSLAFTVAGVVVILVAATLAIVLTLVRSGNDTVPPDPTIVNEIISAETQCVPQIGGQLAAHASVESEGKLPLWIVQIDGETAYCGYSHSRQQYCFHVSARECVAQIYPERSDTDGTPVFVPLVLPLIAG